VLQGDGVYLACKYGVGHAGNCYRAGKGTATVASGLLAGFFAWRSGIGCGRIAGVVSRIKRPHSRKQKQKGKVVLAIHCQEWFSVLLKSSF
jgi:hypothetical protein